MAEEVATCEELSINTVEPDAVDFDSIREKAARERTTAKLRLVWNSREFILRLTGLGLVLSTLIALLIPKRYESTTRLMPPDQISSSMTMLAAAAGSKVGSGIGNIAGDLLGMKSSGELFIGLIQSRTVKDSLIQKFDLRKIYRDRLLEGARSDLDGNTLVGEDRKSGIITIAVTDKSPQRAAAMAQEYVAQLNIMVTRLNTSSAHRERVFLEERLAQVKQDLETAENGFGEFASKNMAVDIQAQGKAMFEAAAALDGQLIAAQTELQGMKQIYADDNVRVRSLQARVEELQRQLQKLGGGSDPESTPKGDEAQSAFPSIRRLPLLGVSYADLYRSAKVQEALFETLTQEYELAKVEEAKETPSIKVIDPANIPETKSYPPRLLITLSGTLLIMCFGVAWILVAERWTEIDQNNSGKVLALEVAGNLKSYFLFHLANGSSIGTARNDNHFSDGHDSTPPAHSPINHGIIEGIIERGNGHGLQPGERFKQKEKE